MKRHVVPVVGNLLVSCAEEEAVGTAEPLPRDTLVIALSAEPRALLAPVTTSAADSALTAEMAWPLLEMDFDCEMKFRPGLAEAWEWNEDGTVLRMRLREGAAWSDGAPLTAGDVAFATELIADPAVASPRLADLDNMVPGKRPLVIDDTHLEWHFTHAYDRAVQLSHVSVADPVPRHVLGGADRAALRGNPFHDAPVVSGRWRLRERVPGERLVLEPNERFSGPVDERPKVRQVVFRVLPDASTRLVELESGGVDLVSGLTIEDADRIARDHPEIALRRRGLRAVDFVAWNAVEVGEDGERGPHPLFGDRAVRRALTLAIDVGAMAADLLGSRVTGEVYGQPAVSTFSPEICAVRDAGVERLPYDPGRARSELAAAGWSDHDGDGIVDKDGRPFRFRLHFGAGNPRREKEAVLVQANLRAVGVEAELDPVDAALLTDRSRSREFDAVVGGLAGGLYADPRAVWHSGPEYEFNLTSYANPHADALIERGLAEVDPAAAAATWRELQRVIYEDQPVTFLFWRDEIVAVSGRFQDARIDLIAAFRDLHRWWVPPGQVKYPASP